MSIFERYDDEYRGLTSQISSKISDLQSYSTGDKSPGLQLTAGLLRQADDLIKQMEVEARGSGDRELQKKTKTYKKTLGSLKADFEACKQQIDRSGLLAGAGGEDRNRLLQTTDNLGRQNETLDNARRVMAETEDVALEITEELGRNREKITSARSKVLEVSSMTNQARRLVHSMSKRETQQKIMMYGLAFILIGAIVVVIYYMQKD
ncbi:hypothetical protein TrLO_g13525 [Triparma laevis f. longispina]|uniref:Vesicle transport v-SNARE N-terminal domain-containing protein n=1 Tax=Triparma laevis f. longispina TaxID=1714387 RepID=A0A9W7KZP4_9STRA|nr:hypothetical protein TrLO_g13525 [Triparma laevis f. longispina]